MYERILIVLEDDATSAPALQEGLALARCHGAEALLLAVLPTTAAPVSDLPTLGALSYADFDQQARVDAQRRLGEAQAAADRAGVRHRQLLGTSHDTAQAIAETASALHCDLVVLGGGNHNAVMRLLTGSLVPGLITHAPVPVLVCRAPSPAAQLVQRTALDGPLRRRRRAGLSA